MPQTVVIIHGTKSAPDQNWFPWLTRELKQRGVNVICPRFPTPDNQNMASWRKVFRESSAHLVTDDLILVGHSLGAAFALRVACETSQPFLGVVGVCPFAQKLGNIEYDELNKDFIDPAWNWQRLRAGAKHIQLFASDNDPYIPLEVSGRVQEAIGATMTIVPGGGHLNNEAGFTQFPMLLRHLQVLCHSASKQ